MHDEINEKILEYEEELQKMKKKLDSANRLISRTVKRYMPSDVVEVFMDNAADDSIIQASTINAAFLFCDLRDFTLISEMMSEESLMKLLNIWSIGMGDMIEEHHGTIIDYIGDSIFAVFGALKCSETAHHDAVAAALAMQKEMISINELGELMGYPHLDMGIGIHYGNAVAGSVGSRIRLKYDIIGRNVNLASRIQTYTVGNQILVSQPMVDALRDEIHVGNDRMIVAKGVAQPMRIYEVLGLGEEMLLKTEESFEKISPPKVVCMRLLSEKDIGNDIYEVAVLEYSEHEVILQVPTLTAIDTDIVLSCEDSGECYGKIVELIDSDKVKAHCTKAGVMTLLNKDNLE